jgi:hypothetical protein
MITQIGVFDRQCTVHRDDDSFFGKGQDIDKEIVLMCPLEECMRRPDEFMQLDYFITT